MEQLKHMLEAYRNGDRPMPTYAELAAISDEAAPLTMSQALVLTGFTGVSCCNFGDFQDDVEKRLGRSVWTHEFGSKEFADEIREMYRPDFLRIMPTEKAK